MVQTNLSHVQVVTDGITGNRPLDERIFSSIAVLQERLERLKKMDDVFSRIEFSPALEQLEKQQQKMTVG